jgi:hypothetical protein
MTHFDVLAAAACVAKIVGAESGGDLLPLFLDAGHAAERVRCVYGQFPCGRDSATAASVEPDPVLADG